MQDKIRLSQAVIVEGKYDKIKLESVVDALILATDGFGIFRDKEMRALVRTLAHSCGIVVLTDSDSAGFRIRTHVTEIARGGAVTQVYAPDVLGKERRKRQPGKEGKLGVEGIAVQKLREAFARAGLLDEQQQEPWLTRQDLYQYGLSGGAGSSELRRALCRALELPQRLSTAALLPVLDRMLDRQGLEALLQKLAAQDGGPAEG